jgi:hypothetical protein
MRRFYRIIILALLSSGLGLGLRADDLAGDIARIHIEAIGGKERVERLTGFRAAGAVRAGGREMEFQMWAERPNRIRIEVTRGPVTLIQGWDGENAPWLREGAEGQMMEMKGAMAADFEADSDFDDPLFQAGARGYSVEYAGEQEVEGGAVVKLLVTRDATDQSVFYLASDTYFIIRQDRTQRLPNGETKSTQTYFDDFRPVLGVTMPHSIVVQSGDKILNQTVLSWIEPNPPMESDVFRKPAE